MRHAVQARPVDQLREVLRQRWWTAFTIACTLCGVSLLVGCGSGTTTPTTGTEVSGSVGEWFVRIDEESASAGPVTFRITNAGSVRHEFLVVRTDLAPGTITVGDDARFSESNPALTVVDEIGEWGPGQTKTLAVDLEAGTYQLVCNLAGHYRLGMWVGFAVS